MYYFFKFQPQNYGKSICVCVCVYTSIRGSSVWQKSCDVVNTTCFNNRNKGMMDD